MNNYRHPYPTIIALEMSDVGHKGVAYYCTPQLYGECGSFVKIYEPE